MPYMKNGKRDYARQYEKYDGKDSVKKDRAKRNSARRRMTEAGIVSKGDGKDVAHKKALSRGGSNGLGNLFAEPASRNKSFARNKDGSMKSETSKKERSKKR